MKLHLDSVTRFYRWGAIHAYYSCGYTPVLHPLGSRLQTVPSAGHIRFESVHILASCHNHNLPPIKLPFHPFQPDPSKYTG